MRNKKTNGRNEKKIIIKQQQLADGRAVYKYFVSDQSHLVSFYSSGYYPSTTGLSIAALLLLLCHCNDSLAAAAASQHYFEEKIALLS